MLHKIKVSKLFLGLGIVCVWSLSSHAMEPRGHFDDREYLGNTYVKGDNHHMSRYRNDKLISRYDYPRFDNQPYYFYNGMYYYGGNYNKGIYYHGKDKFRRGHYYNRGQRYHKGKRYNVRNGKYGYYSDRHTYRDSRRYKKIRAKLRRLNKKVNNARNSYYELLDKREHFRRRHNL